MSVKHSIHRTRRLRAIRARMMACMRQDSPAVWTTAAAREAAGLPGEFPAGAFTRFALDNAGSLHYPPMARRSATPRYQLPEDR